MADTSKNIAAVLHGPRNFKIEPFKVPEPYDNEIQIAVGKVGICGSDVHFYRDGSISGRFRLAKPLVMGHEFAGRIVAIGKSVKRFAVGDRVAVEPGVPCRECQFCHNGRYNLCPDGRYFAASRDGSLQNFVTVAYDFCFKIPENISEAEAALIQPIAVAVKAVKRANVQPGSVCLINGAGSIGLCLYLVAKASGCCKTIFTEINEERLKFAKTLGNDIETILLDHPSDGDAKAGYNDAKSPARTIARRVVDTAGCAPTICFDTTGLELMLQASIFALKQNGLLMLVGFTDEFNVLPIVDAIVKEVDIRSIYRCNDCYQAAVNLVVEGRLPGLETMVTHTFPLTKTAEAFETALNAINTGAIKVMIDCNPSANQP